MSHARPHACSSCWSCSSPHPAATGREISDRLGIDRRTVRRDIEALRGLGIPVEGQRGVGGGYAMRPGFRLPPLMLRDDEAVAVALGVVAAGRLGLAGSPESAATALEKIHRALPEQLRRRVQSLEATLDFTAAASAAVPVPADTALVLAEAIRRRRRVRTSYRSFTGERTRRELSPYGLVVHSGRWYLAAHDHTRAELRTFRVDRMRRLDRGRRGRRAARPRGSTPSRTSRRRSRACPGRGRSRCCSTCRSTRPPGACPARWPSSWTPTAARCCGCG